MQKITEKQSNGVALARVPLCFPIDFQRKSLGNPTHISSRKDISKSNQAGQKTKKCIRKTTTVINLINRYQKENNQENKGLMIHLNASDERGIDIIRNQINNFVNSKTLFSDGVKFIILDEVDYMTKNAQQALKYLLEEYRVNIRFCLICNYISKIDESLQNQFIKLRFNELPKKDVISFLNIINKNEKLDITPNQLDTIHQTYNSDMRSMINYMQSNQNLISNKMIIKIEDYEKLFEKLKNDSFKNNKEYFLYLCKKFNMDSKTIIECFFDYIINYKVNIITSKMLSFVENFLHSECYNIEYNLNYFLLEMQSLLSDEIDKGGEEESEIV